MEKQIIYFGQPAKINCDENCHKAWGNENRPRIYPEISTERIFGFDGSSIYPGTYDDVDVEFNEDHYALLADHELPDAPSDPGTYEGNDAKPKKPEEYGNKWCVRECERCNISHPGESSLPLELKDFSQRRYNIPQKS